MMDHQKIRGFLKVAFSRSIEQCNEYTSMERILTLLQVAVSGATYIYIYIYIYISVHYNCIYKFCDMMAVWNF
jgi:hypothetical protein